MGSRHLLLATALLITVQATAAESVASAPMLAAHNEVRASVGVPPLKWSAELARNAADWADTLADQHGCEMVHTKVRGQGENLFWASPVRWSDGRTEVQSVAPGDVVQSWASERANYAYRTNTCRSEPCGHYTQIVWRNTTMVGCARRTCSDKAQIWVCRYQPPGNVVGQKPY